MQNAENHDTGQELQFMFTPSIRMEKKYDLCDFNRGMVVNAR